MDHVSARLNLYIFKTKDQCLGCQMVNFQTQIPKLGKFLGACNEKIAIF
jgi:hypothetical protein